MYKFTIKNCWDMQIAQPRNQGMGVTSVTSHHDVPAVAQPTENMPDTYSLVGTTEK